MPRTDGTSGNARRKQKVYQDILGRTFKTETYNWDGTVYSTSLTSFNERDQVLRSRQFEGDTSSTTFQDTTATFDGHGRMASSHRPEQRDSSNVLKYTTYNYNADDSISSVTDGRGAVTNYTYENSGGTPLRPLLTGMSWSVPQGSGIPVPASVTMAYDNAGNRTQMTDGLGSVTYEYDGLSRMTAESRYFSDLPSAPVPNNRYTIGYSYGLSGNLIGYTDPFGESIDYAQDRRGRLASVTGSSYGGVTNYLGSPGYRAWGPLKELEYGNGLELNVTFNDRLLAETYEIKHPTDTDKKIFGKEYEYYSDGRLKYTKENFQDQQVKRLDRSFSYDHLARVKDAKSGVEASGGTQTNLLLLPYRQNYSYDAFGMLTGRQSTLWTEENWDFSDSFVNNRRTSGWVYDHHGNATYAEQINYEYDSTNMMTKTWRAQSHEMTIGHDGVGREGKRSHRSWDSEEEEWGDWETRYFVHSTVLGQTLTELSETGTKVRTFVVAAGTVVARQFYDSGSNEAVSWELADASGQSIRMTNATGGYTDVDAGSAELDALGNNVGTHGSLSDPRNSEGEVSPANRSTVSADAFCSRAGVVGPCWIVSLLNRGQTMGSKGSDLPMEMVGDSNPASLSRHPFYFAFYRNSLEAAEDDGRWIQTDWDVTYEENLSGTNDSSVTIIGRVNAMTFIPPASLPGPEGEQCPDPPCEGLGQALCGLNPITRKPGILNDSPSPNYPANNAQGTGREGLRGNIRAGNGGSGGFGERSGGGHDGIDIASPLYQPVFASMDGIVRRANQVKGVGNTPSERSGPSQNYGWGGLIVINYDGQDLNGVYAHLWHVYVKEGAQVSAGDLIGLTGRSGNANNPDQPSGDDHLHYGRFTGNYTGGSLRGARWIDPQKSLNSPCP